MTCQEKGVQGIFKKNKSFKRPIVLKSLVVAWAELSTSYHLRRVRIANLEYAASEYPSAHLTFNLVSTEAFLGGLANSKSRRDITMAPYISFPYITPASTILECDHWQEEARILHGKNLPQSSVSRSLKLQRDR